MAVSACTSRPIHLILFHAPVLSTSFHVQSSVISCQLKNSLKLVCKSNRANTSIRLRPSILEKQQQHRSSNVLFENGRWRLRSGDEDFNAGEGEGENEDGLGKEEGEEEDTLDWNDYETDYSDDISGNDFNTHESGTFVNTQGWKSEMLVPHTINQNEFHKIHLLDCDFFIRKVPDPDDDVFDFREMYVSPPDVDVYSIPEVVGKMPNKYIRLRKSDYGCYNVIELPVSRVRDPFAKTEFEVMKVFLMKHYKNRRADDPNFVLDFEEIYVIDSKTKSISRANVLVNVAGGKSRDRRNETLIVRDQGTSFKIIPLEARDSPDVLIERIQWEKSRKEIETYLRSFRDFYHIKLVLKEALNHLYPFWALIKITHV